jgi:hypothetical protein
MIEEKMHSIRDLVVSHQKGEREKVTEVIRIHCTEKLKHDWKVFIAENDFSIQRTALAWLLEHYTKTTTKPGGHVITAEKSKQV